MSVLVGATSVDDAISRIDNLHRIAGLDRDVIDAAKAARAHLTVVTQRLAADEARAQETEAATAATVVALAATQREQAATLASLHAERSANSSRISTLESQARELAASPSAGQSGRTLTVLATGYSLDRPHGDGRAGRLRHRRRRPERDPARHADDDSRLRRGRRRRHGRRDPGRARSTSGSRRRPRRSPGARRTVTITLH